MSTTSTLGAVLTPYKTDHQEEFRHLQEQVETLLLKLQKLDRDRHITEQSPEEGLTQ